MVFPTKALEYATKKHEGQTRKYTGEPYITHPTHVAAIIAVATNSGDLLAAAVLHDTVEDTDATIEEIRELFGERTAVLVEGLTNVTTPADGNRETRKRLDRERIAKCCADVHTIKLADIIHNCESIIKEDPGFAKTYLAEKRLMLPVLADGDEGLYRRASEVLGSGNA